MIFIQLLSCVIGGSFACFSCFFSSRHWKHVVLVSVRAAVSLKEPCKPLKQHHVETVVNANPRPVTAFPT